MSFIFVETKVRMVSLLKQLACTTAEVSRMHVRVHGKSSLVLKVFKGTWNESRIFSQYQHIYHEKVFSNYPVLTRRKAERNYKGKKRQVFVAFFPPLRQKLTQ